jgi:uncharacterized membrane protein YkvA (DUF1232 family)
MVGGENTGRMDSWWQVLVAISVGLLLLWLSLVGAVWMIGRNRIDERTLREALRLLPDVIRLLGRIAADSDVPRSVRVGLLALIGYVLLPIDLIPDFIPVLGFADDAVIVALTLRWVVRRAGGEVVTRHWPGTIEGLWAVQCLSGLAMT